MSIEERLDLERDDRRHEGTLARLGGRLKFTGCRECMSPDGMRSAGREALAEFLPGAIERFAPWYREPGNDLVLYHPCLACNWKGGRGVPDNLEPMSVADVLTWADEHDPMAPDYAALAAEPVAATAGQDSRAAAGMEDTYGSIDRPEFWTNEGPC